MQLVNYAFFCGRTPCPPPLAPERVYVPFFYFPAQGRIPTSCCIMSHGRSVARGVHATRAKLRTMIHEQHVRHNSTTYPGKAKAGAHDPQTCLTQTVRGDLMRHDYDRAPWRARFVSSALHRRSRGGKKEEERWVSIAQRASNPCKHKKQTPTVACPRVGRPGTSTRAIQHKSKASSMIYGRKGSQPTNHSTPPCGRTLHGSLKPTQVSASSCSSLVGRSSDPLAFDFRRCTQ